MVLLEGLHDEPNNAVLEVIEESLPRLMAIIAIECKILPSI